MAAAGFPVTAADILTAPVVAASYLAEHYPGARCLLLNSGDIGEDLGGVTLARENDLEADVVLVGGAGAEFSYQALNRAFGCLEAGARLVAMHRGMYWRTSEGLQLDSGAFITGLEQAAFCIQTGCYHSMPRGPARGGAIAHAIVARQHGPGA